MGRRAKAARNFDVELADLPRALRHREFLGRIEAVFFAAPKPVTREALARVIADDFNIDELIDDLREELKGRAFELVYIAGGWQLRTRKNFADAIQVWQPACPQAKTPAERTFGADGDRVFSAGNAC